MSCNRFLTVLPLIAFLLLIGVGSSQAIYRQQCPADDNLLEDSDGDGDFGNDHICLQIGSGDGFAVMADGYPQYIFGFSKYGDIYTPADTPPDPENAGNMWDDGSNPGLILAANWPAPTIKVAQGKKFFLTLHNVGMLMRPDLFDPHTVHYHGFPNVASVFDGLPDSAIAINMGSSLTYFYHLADPGTYMYHCHVEATEHMQMGMLGNFYVTPMQDGTSIEYPLASGNFYTKFAYNDIDGATGYDVDYPLQVHSFDPEFHDANENTQPLPFADMHDVYPMFNGRGYPDTVNPGNIANVVDPVIGYESQTLPSLITANVGERILLRLSSLATAEYYTLTSPSIPMTVVGQGAKILRGGGVATGLDMSYTTNSVNMGGGESLEVILDTTGLAPGTYFIYSGNLNQLSNRDQDFGGMMTEIIITNNTTI